MKRRVDEMTGAALARREAAWRPCIDRVAEVEVASGVFAAQRDWPNLSLEEQKAGWAEISPWGDEEDAAAWLDWWEAFDATLEEKGVGEGWPGVWPEQVPTPPQEPAGLWDTLHAVVTGKGEGPGEEEAWPVRCAAARAMLWLAIARSLRRPEAGAAPRAPDSPRSPISSRHL